MTQMVRAAAEPARHPNSRTVPLPCVCDRACVCVFSVSVCGVRRETTQVFNLPVPPPDGDAPLCRCVEHTRSPSIFPYFRQDGASRQRQKTGNCERRTRVRPLSGMGGRLSLPSRTTEVDESGRVHAEMIDELSVLTACAARVKP